MKINQLIVTITLFLSSSLSGRAQSLPLPYYTGFDTQQEQDSWEQFRLGVQSINDWGFGTSYACSTPTGLAHDYYVSGSATDTVKDWFVSPAINLSVPSILSFKISPTMFGTIVGMWLSTGSKNPADGDYVELGTYELPYTVWNECRDTSVTISTVSSTAYIAIKYVGSIYNAFGIDDILVTPQSQNKSVELNQLERTFSIDPNPMNDQSVIRLPQEAFVPNLEMIITDISGREVREIKIQEQEQIITKDGLKPGIYLVQLYQNKQLTGKNRLVIE